MSHSISWCVCSAGMCVSLANKAELRVLTYYPKTKTNLTALFSQDSSLRVQSLENVSLNARNENGDVTGRISMGESERGHMYTWRNA